VFLIIKKFSHGKSDKREILEEEEEEEESNEQTPQARTTNKWIKLRFP